MKKALSIILTVCMILTMLIVIPFTANANEKDLTATDVISGTTGDCTWKIEGTVLTISGNGEMGIGFDNKNGTGTGMSGIGTVMWQPWCCGRYDYSQSITEIVIEEGVTGIADCAFFESEKLQNITIPSSIKKIGKAAFYGCSSLTSITLNSSIEEIGISAFDGCTNLTDVYSDDLSVLCRLTYAKPSDNPLYYANNIYLNGDLFTDLVIPETFTQIGQYAFYTCTCLKSLNTGNSLKSITNEAFYGCSGLTDVTIGNSVEEIASKAFYNCTGLTSVTIPATVTDIYEKAFGYYYKEGFGESKVKNFTIYGYQGSEAQRYANDNNFMFVALDSPTEPGEAKLYGDIDGDGVVGVMDATFIQRYAAEMETPYPLGEAVK